MSMRAIEVPMQPYAGKLLIIDQLVIPDSSDEPAPGKKESSETKFSDMPRPSFFEPKVIEKTLLKYCTLENMPKQFKDELVNGLLAAVETYMKHLIGTVIELCEHRSGNNLYNDPRCVVQHNMRTTMMFLNDREVSDFGCSDDDTNYGHRRRWMKLQRNRTSNSVESEIRLESTNNTALLALGARKPTGLGAAGGLFGTATGAGAGLGLGAGTGKGIGMGTGTGVATAPQRSFVVRIKHVNVKDIIQFMEEEKRYAQSKLLYDAYLIYKL
ncbi:hypothetical protein ACLKA6_016389 [Drosophila palustris]